MYGPEILVRTMSATSIEGKYGNRWQYHSRSDRHSKAACWGIAFDLLLNSDLLRSHANSGEVVFGINHQMRDFKADRKKDLDLVICTPRSTDREFAPSTLRELRSKYEIRLTDEEEGLLDDLDLNSGPVGSVRVAMEAKACMTAHVKAIPRLHDELDSSQQTIHGAADHAIAIGYAMVNLADRFVSPDMNKFDLDAYPVRVSEHDQPKDTIRVIEMMKQLPRRTKPGEVGYDAFGISVVKCRNDGSEVELVTEPPAPQPGDIFSYEDMIRRATSLYENRYRTL